MATITWNAPVASNWSDPYNWNTYQVPGPSDDVVFNNTSIKSCVVDTNVEVNSITISSTYTGSITADGYGFTVYGNFTDSGGGPTTGNRSYGYYIVMLGANTTLHISPSGAVTYTECELNFGNIGQHLETESKITWGRIVVYENCSVICDFPGVERTQLNVSSWVTPLRLGENAIFNHHAVTANFILTYPGDLVQMAPGSVIKGYDRDINFKMGDGSFWGNGNYTLPNFNYIQSGATIAYVGANFFPYQPNTTCTLTLTGDIVSTRTLAFSSSSGSNFEFHTDNYNITCSGFYSGCTNSTGIFTAYYGNSLISVSGFSGSYRGNPPVNKYNWGTIYQYMETSTWTLRDDARWNWGTLHNVDPGTFLLIGQSGHSVGTANKPFYDIQAEQPTTGGFTFTGNVYINNYWGGSIGGNVSIWATGDIYTGAHVPGSAFNITGDMYLSGYQGVLEVGRIYGQSMGGLYMQGYDMHIYLSIYNAFLISHMEIAAGVKVTIHNSGPPYNNNVPTLLRIRGSHVPLLKMLYGSQLINDAIYGGISFEPTATMTLWELDNGVYWTGSGPTKVIPVLSRDLFTVTIPEVAYTGTGFWQLSMRRHILRLTGHFNINRNTLYLKPSASSEEPAGSESNFYTQDNNITCGEFVIGCPYSNRGYKFWFGASVIDITKFNGVTYTYGGYQYFETSQWFCGGDWSFGTTRHIVDIGTSCVTITDTGKITPNGKNFYDLHADSNTGTVTLMGNIDCHDLWVISGNYSQDLRTVEAFGNILFDGYGTLNTGHWVYASGVFSTVRISSTVGTITSNQTFWFITAIEVTMQIDQHVTFKYLRCNFGANARLHGLGSVRVQDLNTPFLLDNYSYFVVDAPLLIEVYDDYAMSLYGNSWISGSSYITVFATESYAQVSIPALHLYGTVSLNIIKEKAYNLGGVVSLMGSLYMNGDLTIKNNLHTPIVGQSPLVFNANEHPITANNIKYGNTVDFAITNVDFGASNILINGNVNSNADTSGTVNARYNKSTWTVKGDWTFPTNHNNYHAWDSVTFVGNSTVTCNGKDFNWVYLNDTSNTLTLAGDLVCREIKIISGTLNYNGYSLQARGDKPEVTTST